MAIRLFFNLVSLLSLAAFIIIERILRKGGEAKSFRKSESDGCSTNIVSIIFILCILSVISSFFLNLYRIAPVNNNIIPVAGLFLIPAGLAVRIEAAKTLGAFYTRTLMKAENQNLIREGIYKYLRHPGYSGTLLLYIGCGFTAGNWIALPVCALLPVFGYIYRITVEEKMLAGIFGNDYIEYSKTTKRLIPFIY